MGKQDIGDLEAVRVAVEAWLQRALPDRPGLRIAPPAWPASSGESSVTLLLDARWPDDETARYVLRMVPPKSEVFESHDLRMQVQMMELMRAEGIPAPEVLGYEPDASLVGSDFYVMHFCEGRIPPDNPPMAFVGWVKEDLDESDRAEMWANGLETLAAIHRVDPAKHDLSRLPRARPGEPLVAEELRKFDSMFTAALRERCDPGIVEAWEWLQSTPPAGGTRRLCWGDSRPGNVIWRENRPVAVIDWEMANLADPLSDLAWWVWIDRCNCLGLGAEPLPGVPAPREVFESWHAQTGLPIDDIAWFELFTVVRYAIVLELKFAARAAGDPDAQVVPNFVAPFIPELMAAARAR